MVGLRGALVYQLDTIEQRRHIDASGPSDGYLAELTGQLRAAMLYSGGLTVLDTQVFDGAVLLDLGPERFRDMVGGPRASAHVTILLRHSDPRESMRSMFEGEFVAQTPLDTSTQRSRDAWVAALESRWFTSQPWDRRFFFAARLGDRLAGSPPPRSTDQAVVARLVNTTSRSEMRRITDGIPAGSDRSAVLGWWEAAYMDVLAEQHATRWVDFDDRASDHPLRIASGRSAFQAVDPAVVARLQSLAPDEFATIAADARGALGTGSRSTRATRLRLAVTIARSLAVPHPLREAVGALVRILAWALVAAALIMLIVGSGAPSKAAAALGILAGLLGAVGSALQIPSEDVEVLIGLARRRDRAIIWQPPL